MNSKMYYSNNKESIKKQHKAWYFKNKELHKQKARDYYKENKEDILLRQAVYYKKNKKKIRLKRKNYILKFPNNSKYIQNKIWRRKYRFEKYKKDLSFKLKSCLRSRLVSALKGYAKSEITIRLLGCSVEYLKNYLESKFKPGMSWSNYGKWHIDHIKPCASFDLSKPGNQQICFHYTNLQPLWAKENLIKGVK